MAAISNNLWMITSAVGAGLCFVMLALILGVALHPVSRPHLDRVSFRILVYALVANTVFGIVNSVGGSFKGPTWTCGFTVWILQLTLELSCFLLMCIALNLQLVVVHQVDGKKMEKFYVFGSILISIVLTVPPFASQQYGWDKLTKNCWYANDDPSERLAWQIGTQLFWTCFTVAGEVIMTSTVIAYIFKQVPSNRLSLTSRRASFSEYEGNAKKYRSVLLRIAMYPIASCLINLTSVVCVLYSTANGGVKSMVGYRILLISDFLYGGRAIIYALIAATDPSFLRAWNAFSCQHQRSSSEAIKRGNRNSLAHGAGEVRLEKENNYSIQVVEVSEASASSAQRSISTVRRIQSEDTIEMEMERKEFVRKI